MAKLNQVLVSTSIENPLLATLARRQYTSKWTPVPDSVLPPAMQAQLAKIFHALSGQELGIDGHTLAVSAEVSGGFKRLYGPAMYAKSAEDTNEGLFVINWGPHKIYLTVDESRLVPVSPGVDKGLFISFASFNFGRGEDTTVLVQLQDGNDMLSLHVQGRFPSLKDQPKPSNLGTFLQVGDTESLVAEFTAEGQRTGGGTSGETYDARDLVPGNYVVTGYKQITRKGGKGETSILQVAPAPAYNQAVAFGVWGNPTINAGLLSSPQPEITPEKPARLIVPEQGRAFLVVESTSDPMLSW